MRSRQSRVSAFTLIELMISIALVLALMIGVNYVFSSVGQATGLTQAMSRVTREMQGAQGVMSRDFGTADMANAPFIVLRSSHTPAFRNQEDYSTAQDQTNPLVDAVPHTEFDVDNRNHRSDILMFFSRDKFARQTGGGTFNGGAIQPYLADMNGQEAMIWYGHLWLPDDNGAFPVIGGPLEYPNSPVTYPGYGNRSANPNNFLANQWYLGRMAIILQQATAGEIITKRAVLDASGNPTGYNETSQWHIADAPGPVVPGLQHSSLSTPPGYRLEQSRLDLAGTSMASVKDAMTTFPNPYLLPGSAWWSYLMTTHRFQARPFVLGAAGSRLSPADVALQAPIFLSNCSQFIVEYAGDFRSQPPNNIGNTPDGQIDYYMDKSTIPFTRRVQWYGYPRNTAGRLDTGIWYPAPDEYIRAEDGDVVPLRDYWGGSGAPFERTMDTSLKKQTDYLHPDILPLSTVGDPAYTCAWGPNETERPSMFRIVIGIDDPNGRFADPLMFEYVFKVP